MRGILATLAIVALAACAPQAGTTNAAPNSTATASDGTAYKMASLIGIGDIVITDEALITSDGQVLPFKKVEEGVYLFPLSPSRLTNGEDFCFSKPVSYFTWHKHTEGLWVMNVGDWLDPPKRPDANTWAADGGCGLFTYEPA